MSWEVDPEIAYDRERTFEEAKRLHEWIDEPNLYVKIPATEPGVGAIEDSVAAGRNINVTLIFSLQRHEEVMEAYIRGLERFAADGGDLVDGALRRVVLRLARRHRGRQAARAARTTRDLQGKLAIANAKLAYQNYKRVFSGERWDALAAKGAHPQRCLWASTSTKNPAYRDVMYVEELIGPYTVNTMPEETIQAFQDHGDVADTLEQGLDKARAAAGRPARGRHRLRRRDRHARARRRAEVHRLVRRAEAGDRREARRARRRVTVATDVVERIWARDPTVWTGADEAQWLGWLDEPQRMLEQLDDVLGSRTTSSRRARSTTSSCSAWAARRSRPR